MFHTFTYTVCRICGICVKKLLLIAFTEMPQIMYFSKKIIITGYNWFKALFWLRNTAIKCFRLLYKSNSVSLLEIFNYFNKSVKLFYKAVAFKLLSP